MVESCKQFCKNNQKNLDEMKNEWYINQAAFEADNLIRLICLVQIHGEVSKWS